MDLDDLLEDLVRRVERTRRTARASRGAKGRARAGMLRAGAVASGGVAALSGSFGALVLALTEGLPGDVIGGAGLAGAGVFGLGALAAGRAARRRDPRRGPSRREARRLARLPHAQRVQPADLPRAVRGDWVRLQEARGLVADLTDDGWIDLDTRATVDDEIDRLARLLEADGRATRMGGRANHGLHAQVGELADLLVALADEAVEHQAAAGRDGHVPATLTEAHDRLVSLRHAREVVDRIDRAAPPRPATWPSPGTDAAPGTGDGRDRPEPRPRGLPG